MEDPEGGKSPSLDDKKKHVQLTVEFEKQREYQVTPRVHRGRFDLLSGVQFKLKQTTPFDKMFKAVAVSLSLSITDMRYSDVYPRRNFISH